jgi:hypothetical protein
VKGTLTLTAMDDSVASSRVQLDIRDPFGFNFQTHPKVSAWPPTR